MKSPQKLKMLFRSTSGSDSVNIPGPGILIRAMVCAAAALTTSGPSQLYTYLSLNNLLPPTVGVTDQHLLCLIGALPDCTGTPDNWTGFLEQLLCQRVRSGDSLGLTNAYSGTAPTVYSASAVVIWIPD